MPSQPSILNSTKWSGLGELGAKLITPVTTMILARLLTPSAFGVVAVCNMLISFADILVDAGFGKYIVMQKFDGTEDLHNSATVAFWTQLSLAICLWIVIWILKTPIAVSLGSADYALVIVVASLQIILMSMISIPMGLLRRDFKFKKLFKIRLLTASVPLMISVPLAYITRSYWALIVGTLAANLANMIALNFSCNWKPDKYYSWNRLAEMWKYCFWSMMEGLAHWCILWIDIFIISRIYDAYYIGLYKNSTQILLSLIGTVTAAMSPVLLASLSRTKDTATCNATLYSVERAFMYVMLPMAVIIYLYRHLITNIILGSQWLEGSLIIGLWGIMLIITIFVYSFPAEAYKAKGKPMILFLFQISYLLVFVPICYWFAQSSFWDFIKARFLCVSAQILLFLIFSKVFLKWDFKQYLKDIAKPLSMTSVFGVYCLIVNTWIFPDGNITSPILSLLMCMGGYVFLIYRHKKSIKATLINLKHY